MRCMDYLCGGVSQMARAGHSRPKAPLCQVCQTGLIAAISLSVCVWPGRWILNNDTGTDSAPRHTKEKEGGRRRGRRAAALICPVRGHRLSAPPFNFPNNGTQRLRVAHF